MKSSKLLLVLLVAILLWAAAWLVAPAKAQSDRPCGAPFVTANNCLNMYHLTWQGSSFQAADAPLGSCAAGYTHDVWVRFVAFDNTMSFGITNYTLLGNPIPYPAQVEMAIYQESPDCNNLNLISSCPSLCPLGIACIQGPNEYQGLAREASGLTIGTEYYLRMMWNPTSTAPPDSFFLGFNNGTTCVVCGGCPAGATILDQERISLQGQLTGNGVKLVWETESSLSATDFWVERRNQEAEGSDWERLTGFPVVEKSGRFSWTDATFQTDFLSWRVGAVSGNGTISYSNVVTARSVPHENHLSWENNTSGSWIRYRASADVFWQVVDLQGRELDQGVFLKGEGKVQPDLQQAKGLVLLHARFPDGVKVLRLLVE